MKRQQAALSILGVLTLWAALAAPTPAAAQVVRWADDLGRVHLTDDPNSIPRRAPSSTLSSARTGGPREGLQRAAEMQTLEALTALEAVSHKGVSYQDYLSRLADARSVFDRSLPHLNGPARSMLVAAMACHNNAADAWRVWNVSRAAWAQRFIQRSWACGAEKTAEARQYLGAGEAPPATIGATLSPARD